MNCPICVTDISSLDLKDQIVHCNKCLDSSEPNGQTMASEPVVKDCPICGKSNGNHVLHIKSCAKDNFIAPKELVNIINKSIDVNCSQFPAQIDFKARKRAPKKPKDPKAPKVAKEEGTPKPRKRGTKTPSDGSSPKPKAKRVTKKNVFDPTVSAWVHIAEDGDEESPLATRTISTSNYFNQDGDQKMTRLEAESDTSEKIDEKMLTSNKKRRMTRGTKSTKDIESDTSEKVNEKMLTSNKKGRMTRGIKLTKDMIDDRVEKLIRNGNVISNVIKDGKENDEMPFSWLLSSLTIGSLKESSYVARDFNPYVPSSFPATGDPDHDSSDEKKGGNDSKNPRKKMIPKPITAGYFDPIEVVESNQVLNLDESAHFIKKINCLVNNPHMSDLLIKLGDKTLHSHLFLWKLQTNNHSIITNISSVENQESVSNQESVENQESVSNQESVENQESVSNQELNEKFINQDNQVENIHQVDLSRFKRSSVVSFLKYVYTGKVMIAHDSLDDFKQLLNYVACDQLIKKLVNE